MRFKQRILRLFISFLMLCSMWVVSLLPAHFLNIAALWAFGGCLLLLMVFGWITFKKKYLVFIWLLMGCVHGVVAQDVNQCEGAFNVSVAEGRWCMYSNTAEQYGDAVCSYIKSFDPQKVKSQDEAYELQTYVNMADRIVQAYNDLDKAHQDSVGSNCSVLTAKDRDSSLKVRLKKLRENSGAICCGWAMQTMNQIYSSQFAERQIQTIPMMLADEKNQCWPCDVIYLLIVLINTLVYSSGPAMAAAGIFFLKWAFIFWLVAKIGMLFLNRGSDRKEYTGSKFLQEFFIRTVLVAVVALILGDTAIKYDTTILHSSNASTSHDKTMLESVYQEIVNPIFELIASTGAEMTYALLDGKNNFYAEVAKAVSKRSDLNAYAVAMNRVNYCAAGTQITSNSIYQFLNKPLLSNPTAYSSLKINGDDLFIQNDLTVNILCLSQLSFRGMAPLGAIGSVFVSHAIRNGKPIFHFPGRIPLMPQIFYGLLLNVICWIIGIVVAFRLIDTMLRVAVVVMLTPIWIALIPFPISRGYAVKGFMFFLSAVMGLIEVAIGVGILVPFFFTAIAGDQQDKLIQLMIAKSSTKYVPNLYAFFTAKGCRVLIYILGVSWLAKFLFVGVESFFKKVFGLASVAKIAGKSTLDALQVDIRSSIGATYDFAKKAKASSAPFKTGFENRMNGTKLGNALESAGSFVGEKFGNAQGHVSVAKQRFYDSRPGRAAIAAKQKAGQAYGATKGALKKVGNAMGTGVQNGGKSIIKAGANVSKMGYGLGSIVGIPMMLAGSAVWAGGTATKFAGNTIASTVKKAPSFAKKQFYKGVEQFFHPDKK